jgi:hypothetical protein
MMNQIETFETKLRDELCRWRGDIEVVELTPTSGRYRFYTANHRYSITAKAECVDHPGYLGCQVSTRKPRAGEEHTRGNDLRDGRFTDETWHGILCDIIAFELVPVVEGTTKIADNPPEDV